MQKNHSLKLLLKLNAICMLCLCLLTAFAASAAGNESLTESMEAAGASAAEQPVANSAAPATDTQPALPADPLFTEEQAMILVKESLTADDAWQLEAAGTAMRQGEAWYRIVATDPIGDAHCRLVSAATGEILVESLWKQGRDGQHDGDSQDGDNEGNYEYRDENDQDGQDGQDGENDDNEGNHEHRDENDQDGENDGDREHQDENSQDGQNTQDDETASDSQQAETDNIDVQQEGEYDTSDEQPGTAGSQPAATNMPAASPAPSAANPSLMQGLSAEAKCLQALAHLL